MTIYEVNLFVDKDIFQEFLVWLHEHAQEMLQFPGFLSASILNPEEASQEKRAEVTVQYQLEDRASLEQYFKEFAAGMREKGVLLFNGKFSAQRRILEVVDVYRK
jgi:quinol monooxygenase YgiN